MRTTRSHNSNSRFDWIRRMRLHRNYWMVPSKNATDCRSALTESPIDTAACFRVYFACVVECGGAPPLFDAGGETQNVVRLGPSFPTLVFSPSEIDFNAHPQSGRTLPHSKTWRCFCACLLLALSRHASNSLP